MANAGKIKIDRSQREGHGNIGPKLSVKKGTFMQIGEAVDLAHDAISPNRKSGTSSGGEQ